MGAKGRFLDGDLGEHRACKRQGAFWCVQKGWNLKIHAFKNSNRVDIKIPPKFSNSGDIQNNPPKGSKLVDLGIVESIRRAYASCAMCHDDPSTLPLTESFVAEFSCDSTSALTELLSRSIEMEVS